MREADKAYADGRILLYAKDLEAESERLNARIAMLVDALDELNYSNTTSVAYEKWTNAKSATQADVDKWLSERDAKVLEAATSNIETMNAQMHISIQDVVDALNQMAAERRAKNV